MSEKTLVWGGMAVGSTIGSMLPYVWGGGLMAYTLWGAIGGIAGIYIGFKLGRGGF